MIERHENSILIKRLTEPRKTIQVIAGARQVGKTTLVKQVLKNIKIPHLYCNADAVPQDDATWIAERWQEARSQMQFVDSKEFVLAIDEVQKIDKWSDYVKKEWDSDTFNDINIKVVLLGSSRLLLKKGLNESLAGRYELIPMSHWSYREMHEAFGYDINQYIYFGGYPGAADYNANEARWRRYVRESIVAPAVEKDILQTAYIYKPALMHQLFRLGCAYSSELLSYNKMLGMLQDAGNSSTLANYMETLNEGKLLTGLQKYAIDQSRKYRSTPKLQVYNNALLSVSNDGMTYKKAFTTPSLWGRWVESAVGCHLLSLSEELEYKLYYWRENNEEVDFIVVRGDSIVAIEVKSGNNTTNSGMGTFNGKYHPKYSMVVGSNAMPVEQFMMGDIGVLL